MIETTPSYWPLLTEVGAGPAWAELVATVAQAYGSTLRPWPGELLQGFALPEESRAFLAGYGLPVDPGLPLLRFLAPVLPLHWRRQGQQRLVVLGNDEETELRLREGTGEIVSVRPFRLAAPRFVNSSVVHLLECLRRYAERRVDLERADDEAVVNIAADLRVGIGAVDPRALETLETWWSRALARVEAGFI